MKSAISMRCVERFATIALSPRASRIACAIPSAGSEASEDRKRRRSRAQHLSDRRNDQLSTEVATINPSSSPAKEKTGKPPRKQIRGKLKAALDLMVFGDDEQPVYDFLAAARKVGFTVQAMRKALERPHIRAYLTEQKQVFRESASAQNIRRAIEIRDQDENRTASIQAIRYLDGERADGKSGNTNIINVITPGIVVDLSPVKDDGARTDGELIEVNPSTEPRSLPRNADDELASDGNGERN